MMHLVWALWISIPFLVIGTFSEGSTRPDIVNIGAIFSFSTIDGMVAKIAMKAAEEDVNSDPAVLGGTKLAISMHDSNYSGFLGILGALRFMEADTIAIIGAQSSVIANLLSPLANELHVPLLSFTALDPNLSPVQYPYFIQTAPNDTFQMAAIANMVSYFGWRDVIAVYSDEDGARNSIAALGDILAERLCKISYKTVLDLTATRADIVDELVKLKKLEWRIIVVHTFSKTGLLVLMSLSIWV